MKYVFLFLILLALEACGVKADPVPPTPEELARVKPSPTPESTPALRKRAFPEYDQRNDPDENDY